MRTALNLILCSFTHVNSNIVAFDASSLESWNFLLYYLGASIAFTAYLFMPLDASYPLTIVPLLFKSRPNDQYFIFKIVANIIELE